MGPKEEWIANGVPEARWWRDAYITKDQARLWHDAALAGVQAGKIPPSRPKVLRTLKAPGFANQPCQVGALPRCPSPWSCTVNHNTLYPLPMKVPGCKLRRKGCVGNVTRWLDAEKTRLEAE